MSIRHIGLAMVVAAFLLIGLTVILVGRPGDAAAHRVMTVQPPVFLPIVFGGRGRMTVFFPILSRPGPPPIPTRTPSPSLLPTPTHTPPPSLLATPMPAHQ